MSIFENIDSFLTRRWAAACAKFCSTFFLCPSSMAQPSSVAETRKTINETKAQQQGNFPRVNCKHVNFCARSLITSHHNHLIEHVHLLCIWHNLRSRLCKPTATYNTTWPCNVPFRLAFLSDFLLTRRVFSRHFATLLCHLCCHCICRSASLPSRCHVCCQGLLPVA